MSPPDTNTEKQKRRHRPVFILLMVAVLVAVVAYMTLSAGPPSVAPGEDATPTATTGDT